MLLTQLQMHNVAPRGVKACCVPTSLCFLTGADYQDVEYILTREQPKNYRPDLKTNGGVFTEKLLGQCRKLFGHLFTSVGAQRGDTVYSFKTRYPTGTYLLQIRRHVFVLKDGIYYDLCATNHHDKLYGAWKVEKVS